MQHFFDKTTTRLGTKIGLENLLCHVDHFLELSDCQIIIDLYKQNCRVYELLKVVVMVVPQALSARNKLEKGPAGHGSPQVPLVTR